ncbi:MAG TPA: FeoB-associated Cys-rich membrane protein [Syntrophales bacterium]|nr:FeoB-associated Cys-rich membrane protein [Syntrophales bacterium]
METILVVLITAFAAAYVIRRIYKGLKKGGEYTCSDCPTCALCTATVNNKKKNRQP